MSFESVNDAAADDDDGRRTNAYPISSPGAFGSGETKLLKNYNFVRVYCVVVQLHLGIAQPGT